MLLHNKSQDLSLRDKIILSYETGMVGKKDANDILKPLMNNSTPKYLND